MGANIKYHEELIAKKMATPPGFEPRLTGPKPVVLPLHHGVAHQHSVGIFQKITPFCENFHIKSVFF